MAKDPANADRYRRAIEAIDKQVAQLNGTTKATTEAQSKLKAQIKEAATAFDQLRQTYDPVNAAAHRFSKQTGQIALLEKNGKSPKSSTVKPPLGWLANSTRRLTQPPGFPRRCSSRLTWSGSSIIRGSSTRRRRQPSAWVVRNQIDISSVWSWNARRTTRCCRLEQNLRLPRPIPAKGATGSNRPH